MVGVVVRELDFATLGINATKTHAAYLRVVAFLYLLFFCIIDASFRYLQSVSIVIFCLLNWEVLVLVGDVVRELDFATLGIDTTHARPCSLPACRRILVLTLLLHYRCFFLLSTGCEYCYLLFT